MIPINYQIGYPGCPFCLKLFQFATCVNYKSSEMVNGLWLHTIYTHTHTYTRSSRSYDEESYSHYTEPSLEFLISFKPLTTTTVLHFISFLRDFRFPVVRIIAPNTCQNSSNSFSFSTSGKMKAMHACDPLVLGLKAIYRWFQFTFHFTVWWSYSKHRYWVMDILSESNAASNGLSIRINFSASFVTINGEREENECI
jgi:hypothetical protein